MKKFVSILLVTALAIVPLFFVLIANADINERERCIIIDAGHGGFDGGAVASDGTEEKDINLQIAGKINSLAKLFGYSTIMTRKEDNALCNSESSIRKNKIEDMKNRLKIINMNPKAVFLSVHMNKFEQENVWGAQVFFSPNNENSKVLAEAIQCSIINYVQPQNTRVIKKADDGIYLLKNAQIPAVIAECGFLSNQNELANLKTDEYQLKLAFAIVMSLDLYYNNIN